MSVTHALRQGAAVVAAGACVPGVLWGIYLNTVGVAADRDLRRPRPTGPTPTTRFRVLVPAHDEERLLGSTLDALTNLDYPCDRYEIHVVADNCSDQTAAIARVHGVDVHERTDPDSPGKGAALAWLIDRLPVGAEDDAFVVVDADTIVDPGMLRAFHISFSTSRAEAIQGYYTVKDADAGGDVGFRAAALAVRHLVRPAGRTALGGSSSLYGNGMAFREPVARRHRWANTLTEDLDMGMRILLDGGRVVFARDAVVAAEMPDQLADAVSQNERWEAGRLMVARDHIPGLVRAARDRVHGRRWAYLDAAIDISIPPLTTVLATSTVAGASLVLLAPGRARWGAAVLAVLGPGLQVVHVAHALRLAEASPAIRRSLLRTPAQILWKSRILTRVIRRRPASWIRTSRGPAEIAA